eukprot:COSAG05_NODE_14_length_36349_cov_27.641655_24_plen_234_part_00
MAQLGGNLALAPAALLGFYMFSESDSSALSVLANMSPESIIICGVRSNSSCTHPISSLSVAALPLPIVAIRLVGVSERGTSPNCIGSGAFRSSCYACHSRFHSNCICCCAEHNVSTRIYRWSQQCARCPAVWRFVPSRARCDAYFLGPVQCMPAMHTCMCLSTHLVDLRSTHAVAAVSTQRQLLYLAEVLPSLSAVQLDDLLQVEEGAGHEVRLHINVDSARLSSLPHRSSSA